MQPYQQATDWKHTEKNNTNKEEQWQVQKQQANSIKEQQKLQQSGMTSNTPVNVNEKSGGQISTPPSPVIVDVDDHCDDNDIPAPVSPLVVVAEVIGGRLDMHEKTFNLQEGDPRGRVVNHAPATTPNDTPQHQKKVHQTKEKGRDTPNQQVHISKECDNQPKGSMATDMGNKAAEQQHQEQAPNDSHPEENPCKDFIMMDQIMDVAPLKAKYATPTPGKPPDQSKVTVRDEYDVDNSEDEVDANNLPINN
ncbi:hypothetical protein H5410_027627 [Solanum commersonii]|uniref:Uncharacterized protein n=1 Tax=Solanum commersonii TaxID=4109 RepID=A0A9J5Z2K6_SOLCO|nr:hypothetical protein H5410_027627 [Solanum commersonii]